MNDAGRKTKVEMTQSMIMQLWQKKKMHEASFALPNNFSFRIFCIEKYHEDIFGFNILTRWS